VITATPVSTHNTAPELSELDQRRLGDLLRCGIKAKRRGCAWLVTGRHTRIWVAELRLLHCEDFVGEPPPRPTVFAHRGKFSGYSNETPT
jgi:hypothetical protein